MTVEIERDALLAALEQVKGVIEARNTIPVLHNVLFVVEDGILTVTGTDLDIEASAIAPAAGALRTTLPSDKINLAAKSFKPGKLTIVPVEGRNAVTVKQGRGVRTISTLPADDFPKRKALERAVSFDISSDALVGLLGACRTAQSTEETRYYLNGTYLHVAGEKLVAVATDGARLIRAETDLPEGAAEMPGIIVPRKAVGHLLGLLSHLTGQIRVETNADAIRLQLGPCTIISKLVDHTYPEYSRVIPDDGSRTVTVKREHFLAPVAAVASIVDAEGEKLKLRVVTFDLGASDDAHSISTRDHKGTSATEAFDAVLTGEPVRFGLNSQYAREVASVFAEGSTLTLLVNAAPSALRITSDKDDGLVGVIMSIAA